MNLAIRLMCIAEPDFLPCAIDDDEEARYLAAQLHRVFVRELESRPIWDQYEFSKRAENVLRRNRITTWPQLVEAVDRACIVGGGVLVLREYINALFERRGGHRAS